MSDSVIAAQLYTLREHTRTPDAVARTLEKVKEIGYDAVQLSALGPIEPTHLARLLADTGLTACATHVAYERLRDDTAAVIAEHQLWACNRTAIPVTPPEYRTAEGYARFAREASELAREVAAAGVAVSYHNHSFEMVRFGDRTGLEILFAEADPDAISAEIDTYWIQHGGGDPAAWIRSLPGRVPLVHLKDMVIYDNQQVYAEVGEGNLNWPGILDACRAGGTEWYIVEQDECRRDPFDSLRISLRNLHTLDLR